jgi:hypothetical protein
MKYCENVMRKFTGERLICDFFQGIDDNTHGQWDTNPERDVETSGTCGMECCR